MFPNPFPPIFPEAVDLPTSSLYKTKYPASGWENGGDRKYPGYPDIWVPGRLGMGNTIPVHSCACNTAQANVLPH